MALLLDTCVAIWLFEGSDEIPVRVLDRILDGANDVYFSDVSLLEIVIKHAIGKFPLPGAPSALIPRLVRDHHLETLPLSSADILRLVRLPAHHRDPFDRLLVAQALENDLVLVTPDPLIHRYKARLLWD
jgi:PIN domain nuclease of toxin-antitoxin system